MTYLKKRKQAFGFAFKGLKAFFIDEAHPKIHALATLLVIALGFWLNISISEWVTIILCIGLVISLEAINSALEKLTDIVSPGFNETAGKVKDIAAGAVLVASIAAGIVGVIIFAPKILALL